MPQNTFTQEREKQVSYISTQLDVALGPENRWFAGLKLGHKPTDEEALKYWIECGAAERWFVEHNPSS